MARLLVQPTSVAATCWRITYADNLVVKLYLLLFLFSLSLFFICHFMLYLLLLRYTFVAFAVVFHIFFQGHTFLSLRLRCPPWRMWNLPLGVSGLPTC